MHHISYDPSEFDEHVDELYPARSTVLIRKDGDQRGQRIIGISREHAYSSSEKKIVEDEEVDIICQAFKPGSGDSDSRSDSLES